MTTIIINTYAHTNFNPPKRALIGFVVNIAQCIQNDRYVLTKRPIRSYKQPLSEKLSAEASLKQAHKKQKVDHPSGPLLPATFWDNLSELWLTHNALRELDRRSNQATAKEVQQQQVLRPLTRGLLREIQKVAKKGGPDLSELRGYPEPKMNFDQKHSLSAYRNASQTSSASQSTKSSTTRNSGPYDRDFQQHLIDHGIYPHVYEYPDGRIPPKPRNWSDIKERLARHRFSLSHSKFTEEMHEKFVRADAHAFNEKQITESVISVIEGDNGDARCVADGILFRNLDHLTDGTLVPGNPDRYHGARPEQLDRRIRNELDDKIIPSTQHDLPIAPNFFLAAKGPDCSASVAKRQACYNGALGARGIQSLQIYGQSEFNNNAYTLTSIYHDGQLQMFTSHPSEPTASGRTEYYMTPLRSFALTGSDDTFREGATWYRNGTDWAKEQRDDAIKKANQQAARDLIESATVNASFSTVCEISDNESVASITEQS